MKYAESEMSNLRCGVKVHHDLAMSVFGSGHAIDQSCGADLRISSTNIGDQSWDDLRMIRLSKRCPCRARVRGVYGHSAVHVRS